MWVHCGFTVVQVLLVAMWGMREIYFYSSIVLLACGLGKFFLKLRYTLFASWERVGKCGAWIISITALAGCTSAIFSIQLLA